MSGKVVRLGAGMAFWGDSVRPAIEMVERGDIDYLCCDHLAELTMSILAKQRAANPERGYTRDVIDLLRGALPACVAKGVLPGIKALGTPLKLRESLESVTAGELR